MSGLGQRIDDGRPMYQPPPKTDRKAKGLRRVSKERAAENGSNDQINENFLFYNPVCACGCGELASTRHHLCSGSFARQASLFDTDVQLPAAEFCNNSGEGFHDSAVWPLARQVAQKWMLILEKVNRYRGRAVDAITIREVMEYLNK